MRPGAELGVFAAVDHVIGSLADAHGTPLCLPTSEDAEMEPGR